MLRSRLPHFDVALGEILHNGTTILEEVEPRRVVRGDQIQAACRVIDAPMRCAVIVHADEAGCTEAALMPIFRVHRLEKVAAETNAIARGDSVPGSNHALAAIGVAFLPDAMKAVNALLHIAPDQEDTFLPEWMLADGVGQLVGWWKDAWLDHAVHDELPVFG